MGNKNEKELEKDDYVVYEHKIDEDSEGLIVKWNYKDKIMFEPNAAFATLLIERKIILNSHWWREDFPEEAQKYISGMVNCNDVFAWACADAEELNYSELEDLFNHFEKDKENGTDIWCIKKRGILPQKPVYDMIQKEGIWDLDKMGLKKNPYE